ncbi:hypothetical protein Ancab_013205, partial [Ancistrocladus abbreviatus]
NCWASAELGLEEKGASASHSKLSNKGPLKSGSSGHLRPITDGAKRSTLKTPKGKRKSKA